MVYCVTFTIELKNESDVPRFLKGFRQLLDHVHEKEPDTVSYEILHCVVSPGQGSPPGSSSDLQPQKFMVLERYRTKQAFTDVHLKSAAFATFFELVNSLEVVETSLKEYDSSKVEL